MGLLLNDAYWVKMVNDLEALRPPLGQPMTRAAAAKVRSMACDALSQLAKDPELKSDLAAVQALQTASLTPTSPRNAPDFVLLFMKVESRIFQQKGVTNLASQDLLEELRDAATRAPTFAAQFDRLDEKIRFCASLACDPSAADSPDDPERSIWSRVWRATRGVAVVSMDAGGAAAATALFGAAGAAAATLVAGASVGYGAEMVDKAIRDRW